MTTNYQSASTVRESNEELYIKTCGERGVETIVETWLDVACPLDERDVEGKFTPAVIKQRAGLRTALENTVSEHTTELQRAEWASMLCGGSDYESWLADQQ